MLIDKRSGRHNQGFKFLTAFLCICFSLFSHSVGAVLVEGKVTGFINGTFTDGGKPQTPFFDIAVEGQYFSADFRYEFDENNFPPSFSGDLFRSYDFGFSAMDIVVHVGDESFSSTAPNDFPLTHYRNLIDIYRGDLYSSFSLMTYNVYSAINPRTNNRLVSMTFNTEAMAHFSGFDLVQNVSIVAPDGSSLGSIELMDYGVRDGDRYPGDFYYYDGFVYGVINSIDIRTRSSTVNESGSLGLLTLALLLIGLRYRGYTKA